MGTATFPQRSIGTSTGFAGDARTAHVATISWRAVEVVAVLVGIVGFGAAVVALRFALSAQHFVTPHLALGAAIATALAGSAAFYGASQLEARRAQSLR